jgi:hypothetical protein
MAGGAGVKRTTRIVIDKLVVRGPGSLTMTPAAIRAAVENAIRDRVAGGAGPIEGAIQTGVSSALSPALKQDGRP